jgi:uncharacterized protein YndB with AHSA1/START domain
MTRVFDAPRELVFEAYTNPAQIPHWWGPREVTTIVDQMDVRPGGVWRYIQRDQDGNEYPFNGEYREIVPPERLVYTFSFEFEFEGTPIQTVVNTATFEERDGKTTLTVNSLFQSIEDRDSMIESGAESGMTESWDRLAEHLAALPERVDG